LAQRAGYLRKGTPFVAPHDAGGAVSHDAAVAVASGTPTIEQKRINDAQVAGGAVVHDAAIAMASGKATKEQKRINDAQVAGGKKGGAAGGKALGGPNTALLRCKELPFSPTECRYCGAKWVAIIPNYANLDRQKAQNKRTVHCRGKSCKAAKTAYLLRQRQSDLLT
jgi:hypothetical protein